MDNSTNHKRNVDAGEAGLIAYSLKGQEQVMGGPRFNDEMAIALYHNLHTIDNASLVVRSYD